MKQLTYILLFSLAFLLSLPSCRKKATTDEEMREMIVGEWRRPIKETIGSFMSQRAYRSLQFRVDNSFILYYSESGSINDIILYFYDDGDGANYNIENKILYFFNSNNNEVPIALKKGLQVFNNPYKIKKLTSRVLVIEDAYKEQIKYIRND
jgi:hypothetical protein